MAFTDASQKGTRFFLVTSDAFTVRAIIPEDDGGTLTGFVFVVRDAPATAAAPGRRREPPRSSGRGRPPRPPVRPPPPVPLGLLHC